DLVPAGGEQEIAELLDDGAYTLFGVVVPGQAREVVVVRVQLAGDDRRRPGVPAEYDSDVLQLVAKPAREEEGADSEAGKDLRQLGRVAEAVREVARAARLDAEAAADPATEQEVAHERLSSHEDLVGQDV